MSATLDLVRRIGADTGGLAVVATSRADGSVHASLVNAGVLDDAPGGVPVVALVARGDARKVALLRRSGRAAVTFHHGWQWVSVEGPVTIVGPGDDGLRDLLRRVFRAAGGSHDDWDEFDRVMAAEARVAVLVEPARIITNG